MSTVGQQGCAGRGNPPAVGRPCHAEDGGVVAAIGERVSAGEGIPDLYGVVRAGGGQAPAIQRPRDRIETELRWRTMRIEQLAASGIPDLHRAIAAGRGYR